MAQLSVTAPTTASLFSNTESADFTFSITSPNGGDTTVTPSNDAPGSWDPATVVLNGGTLSAVSKFTPTQIQAGNLIGATGNNGAVAAVPVNCSVYTKLINPSHVGDISAATRAAETGSNHLDGSVTLLATGSGDYYSFWSEGSDALAGDTIRTRGMLGDPFVNTGGSRTLCPIEDQLYTYYYTTVFQVWKDPNSTDLWGLIYWERNPTAGNAHLYNGISLCKSTDTGATWTDYGRLLTPEVPFNMTHTWYGFCGSSAGTFFQYDGYLYIPFIDIPVTGQNDSTGSYGRSAAAKYLCMARMKISDMLAATPGDPQTICKKYLAGAWTSAGVEGVATDLSPSGLDHSWPGGCMFNRDLNIAFIVCNHGNYTSPFNPGAVYVIQAYPPFTEWSTPLTLWSSSGNQPYFPSLADVASDGSATSSGTLHSYCLTFADASILDFSLAPLRHDSFEVDSGALPTFIGLRYPAMIPALALSGFTFTPPASTPGYASGFFYWLGGNVGGSTGTPPTADETPRMWHVRGGFGRHSIAGQRGYSR